MTGPIDTAHVEILPDLDAFSTVLKAKLDEIFAGMRGDVDRSLSEVKDSFTKAGDDIGAEGGTAGEKYTRGLGDSVKDGVDGVVRDVSGRLRDAATGRFVAAGEEGGRNFRKGFGSGSTSIVDDLVGLFKKAGGAFASVGVFLGQGIFQTLKYTAITAIAPLAGQLVAAFAPAVGALGLLPAVGLAGATALATLKIAIGGVGDALKAGISGDTQKLAEAMKGLAPAAQTTVTALLTLKPAALGLKLAVQNDLFVGLADDVRRLGGSYLPILTSELGRVAGAFNGVIRDAAGIAETPGFVNSVRTALDNVRVAIGNAIGILPGLVSGFNGIAVVGSAFLPRLTAGFAALGDRFSQFIATVAGNGQLTAFIQAGIDSLTQLLNLVKAVGSVVGAVLFSAAGAGGSLLSIITGLLTVLGQFLNSAQGLTVLHGIFAALSSVGDALGGALLAALPALGLLVSALAPVLTAVSPIVGLIGQLIAALATGLVPVVSALIPPIGLLINALVGALQPVLPVITGLFTTLAPILGQIGSVLAAVLAPALQLAGTLLQAILPLVAANATSIGGVLVQALTALQPAFDRLLPAIGQLVTALLPSLLPLVTISGTLLGQLIPVLIPLINLLVNLLVPTLQVLTPVLVFVANVIGTAAQAFLSITGPVLSFVGSLLQALTTAHLYEEIGSFFVSLWNTVAGAFTTAGSAIVTAWNAVLSFFAGVGSFFAGLWSGITSGVKDAADFFVNAFQATVAFFEALPGRIGAALTALPGQLQASASAAFDAFFFSIGFMIGSVIQFFIDLPGRIVAALSTLGSLLVSLWDTVSNAVVTAVSNGINATVLFFALLPGRVYAAAVAVWGLLVGLWNTVSSAVSSAVSTGVNAVIGFFAALPGRVGGALSAVGGLISSTFTRALDEAKSAVSSGINATVLFFAQLPGRAASALSSLGGAVRGAVSGAASWLISAGSDLISGLISGIEGAVGRAVSAVKRAMSDVVSGAKSALGISSPSTVFAGLGDDTVAGYILGVSRNAAAAVAAVTAMTLGPLAPTPGPGPTSAVAPSVVAATAAGATTTSGGDPGTATASRQLLAQIHIHVGDEVVRVVEQVVDAHDRDVTRQVLAGAGGY